MTHENLPQPKHEAARQARERAAALAKKAVRAITHTTIEDNHGPAKPHVSWQGSQHAPVTVTEWIEDHAYAVDDIVLDGDSPLGPLGLAALQELLDIASPQWRDVFKPLPTHGVRRNPQNFLAELDEPKFDVVERRP